MFSELAEIRSLWKSFFSLFFCLGIDWISWDESSILLCGV